MVYSDAIFRDTKKSHNAQLRAACETALQEIQELVGTEPLRDPDTTSISSVLPEPYPESARLDADKYFLPFRLVGCCQKIIIMPFSPSLACQSKTPRLVVISLDGIQKLIAYGHLTGEWFWCFY